MLALSVRLSSRAVLDAREEEQMKVVQKGKQDTYEDFYPEEYEYKLCGGSVEPKDRVAEPAEDEKGQAKEA